MRHIRQAIVQDKYAAFKSRFLADMGKGVEELE